MKTVSSINGIRRTGLVLAKDQFIPYIRVNSKWIKDLNMSNNATKIIEENTGSKISDTCIAVFLPWARETKEKINKWDYIKLKSFCMAKKKSSK